MDENNASPSPPAPPLPRRDSEERTWAMFCHLAALSGYLIPLGHIVGPLIVWNINKDKFPLVDAHGKNSLNFQISITIWLAIGLLLCLLCIGIPIVIGLVITNLVCVIAAAVQASNGKTFNYPISIRFVK